MVVKLFGPLCPHESAHYRHFNAHYRHFTRRVSSVRANQSIKDGINFRPSAKLLIDMVEEQRRYDEGRADWIVKEERDAQGFE